MAIIRLKLFARFAEVFQHDELDLNLPVPVSPRLLRSELIRLRPELASLVMASAFAVNAEYAAEDQGIEPTDEVAIIPPVSGG